MMRHNMFWYCQISYDCDVDFDSSQWLESFESVQQKKINFYVPFLPSISQQLAYLM